MEKSELIERLAALEHERWAKWHYHVDNLASQVTTVTYDESDGSHEATPVGYLIDAATWERWTGLADTEYKNLTEPLKERDRAEVRRSLAEIEAYMAAKGPETAQEEAQEPPRVQRDLEEFRGALRAVFALVTDSLVEDRRFYGPKHLRSGNRGMVVRIEDKLACISNLIERGGDQEELSDLYREIIGLAAVGYVRVRETNRTDLDPATAALIRSVAAVFGNVVPIDPE
jgi:hypothetical protein